MALTAKENTLLQDLRSQEQLCIEKYGRAASEACDPQLKQLFTQLGQMESQHLQSLDQIAAGSLPQMQGGGQPGQMPIQPSSCCQADREKDAFLCKDALAMEKHVSSTYDTCIFEFTDCNLRNVLNHIQKEEQQHGQRLYDYMAKNNMYA